MKGNLGSVQGMDTGRFMRSVIDSKSSYVGVEDMKPGGEVESRLRGVSVLAGQTATF